MKTKTLITVLLVTIVLVSCAPAATSVPPTKTVVPTVTVTVPTLTKTPTQIPATPTETEPSKEDYLAKSENVFPTPEGRSVVDFVCIADFSNIIYQPYTLPDGTVVKAWVTCEDGGTEFLLPLFLENTQMSYSTLSINAVGKKGKVYEFTDEAIKAKTERILTSRGVLGKKVKITAMMAATNSTRFIGSADPFPGIFAGTDFDERTKKFGETGDPSTLLTLPGLGRVLLILRIEEIGEKPSS